MHQNASLYKEIFKRLSESERTLVIAHQNPDGDAVGSMLALAHFLDQTTGNNHIFCLTDPMDSFNFLPGIERISTDERIFDQHEFDTIVILDSGDLKYCGVDIHIGKLSYNPIIVNIDHHPTNTHFGHINLVETNAASTTDILYRIFENNRFNISKDIATCLLTGIMTDTGSFSNLATTPQSIQNASELLINGARKQEIIDNALTFQSIGVLKLWGRAFSRLVKSEFTNIAMTVITQKDFEECGVENDSAEGIANFLNNLHGAKAVLVLKEQKGGIIKGSLRTTQDKVDVSGFARLFGGGGHKKAAGFSIKGRIKETSSGWRIV
ncbi:DHH family phosphoesterase [Patescibacteria group bacterium]|nr:DHH family phosphoesterase [Patescibacteria group bacterium]MBU2235822.1 DHH family phosphoesterase [Patescibacteria group bacterium]